MLDSKKPSKNSFTQVNDTLFYSNDTDAHLVFLPHEQEDFEFNEATVALYNLDDESLVERPATIETFEGRKSVVLKMTEDLLAHWGRWQAQVVFKQGDKINTSVVVKFDTLRYMLDQRPPTLRDVIKVDELYSQLVAVMNEIADKDVISAPEILGARGSFDTLGERLDKDLDGAVAQLEQMVTINVKSFGAVADADYFNPVDNKYYSDANFTKSATDNSDVFMSILYYMNRNLSGRFKVFFPEGNYYSSRTLETSAENIIIEGSMAKLITSTPDSTKEQYCVYVRNCITFKCHGMTFENIIEDKTIISSATGRFYHIWIRESLTKPLTHCNIYDNVFIDKVSIPNSTSKPYNGSVYVDHGQNIFIHDNKFYNNCGRIVYITGCENVNIHDNQFENIGYIPTEVTNVSVGTLVFRILSSKNVKIHHNIVKGTEIYNSNQIVVYGVLLGMNEELSVINENIQVDSNTFIVNEARMDVIRLESVVNSSITNNDVFLNATNPNSKGTFVAMGNLSDTYTKAINISIGSNRVYNAHETTIDMPSAHYYVDKLLLIFSNNQFDSEDTLSRISNFSSTSISVRGVATFIGNRILKNGVYQHDIISSDIMDYNANNIPFRLTITTANLASYLDDNGVLNIPEKYNAVGFNVNSGDITIRDIKINGAYPLGKEISLVHTSGILPEIVQNNSLIRLPALTNIKMQNFQTVKLECRTAYWIKIN